MAPTTENYLGFLHLILRTLIASILVQNGVGFQLSSRTAVAGRYRNLSPVNNQYPVSPLKSKADPTGDEDEEAPLPFRRALLASTLAAATELVFTQNYVRPGFRRLRPTQFIAALGDPQSNQGTGAEKWGVWERDPGPRGIPFDQFAEFVDGAKKEASAGWTVDPKDFWLEEHGIWMETPQYDSLKPGRYLVTGGRSRTSVLTIFPEDERGEKKWELDGGVLYDVTHLPCRSARYVVNEEEGGSPVKARKQDFPVTPGSEMPMVEGCRKQDYAVLFVTGVESV